MMLKSYQGLYMVTLLEGVPTVHSHGVYSNVRGYLTDTSWGRRYKTLIMSAAGSKNVGHLDSSLLFLLLSLSFSFRPFFMMHS